eukprot:7235826-Prymnesium_polylepis.1
MLRRGCALKGTLCAARKRGASAFGGCGPRGRPGASGLPWSSKGKVGGEQFENFANGWKSIPRPTGRSVEDK